jgi:hypothetical protein
MLTEVQKMPHIPSISINLSLLLLNYLPILYWQEAFGIILDG